MALRGRGRGLLEPAPRVELPIRLEGRLAPPLEVQLDRQEILRIFPPNVSTVPTPAPPPVSVQKKTRSDQDVLEAVTSRWVYVGYANVGGIPIGKFRYNDRPQMRESFEVREGDVREGVTIYYLDGSKAMARHDTATIRLPLIDAIEIPISEHPHLVYSENVPDPTLAWKRYWELWGKRFNEMAKDYVPAPGEHLPPKEPLPKEEMKQRIDTYLESVAQRMQERKTHPRYQDSSFSIDDMRERFYQRYGIQVEETPVSEVTEPPQNGATDAGELPQAGP